MVDVVEVALRRLRDLESEAAELRRFIATAQRLGKSVGSLEKSQMRVASVRQPGPSGASPKEIVAGLKEIIREGAEPIPRGELLTRLAETGITVPGTFADKNLGTILWRNQSLFEHVRGQGYRRVPGSSL